MPKTLDEVLVTLPQEQQGKIEHRAQGLIRCFSSEEAFPDGSPAMALRGLRGKEDITQVELAARLGISQNMVSDMESGKRNISLKMAKRIGEEFKIPYKCFL